MALELDACSYTDPLNDRLDQCVCLSLFLWILETYIYTHTYIYADFIDQLVYVLVYWWPVTYRSRSFIYGVVARLIRVVVVALQRTVNKFNP